MNFQSHSQVPTKQSPLHASSTAKKFTEWKEDLRKKSCQQKEKSLDEITKKRETLSKDLEDRITN